MPGIASAATAVVVGYLAGGTSTIRVGAGGIMLPNHSPLVIAEQFGTLEALYPGRIDLGLGRAPGTDQLTARALRRDPMDARASSRTTCRICRPSSRPRSRGRRSRPSRARASRFRSGSSARARSAPRLAALLGLPYAFASHFAPTDLLPALAIYRSEFRPSAQLAAPYAMAGLNVFAADTDEEARRLFTTPQQAFTNRFRGAMAPTCRRSTTSSLLDAGREGAGVGDARVLRRRVAGDRSRRRRAVPRSSRASTS